jgi:hypothetical protein
MYKTIIFPSVLYECETWSLTLRDHRLRVYENRMLRIMFRLKRDDIMGGSRKLHNEELHNVCSSPNVIRMMKSRRMRWAGLMTCMVGKRNAYRALVGKPEGKRPLGSPRHR